MSCIAVLRLYDDMSDYNYTQNSCAQDGVYGYYTLDEWAESYAVGCGISNCKDIDASLRLNRQIFNAWLLFCNYGPAGNISGCNFIKIWSPELLISMS